MIVRNPNDLAYHVSGYHGSQAMAHFTHWIKDQQLNGSFKDLFTEADRPASSQTVACIS